MADRSEALSLDLSFDIDTPSATVAVSGDIDLLTGPVLARVLHVLLDGGRQRIVVDLARCGFVDARGVDVFAEVAGRAAALGGTVGLRSVSSMARRMLDLTDASREPATAASDHWRTKRDGGCDRGSTNHPPGAGRRHGPRQRLSERRHCITPPICTSSEHDGARLRDGDDCFAASRSQNLVDMDDEVDVLDRARRGLDLSVSDLWWRYFAIGGMISRCRTPTTLTPDNADALSNTHLVS